MKNIIRFRFEGWFYEDVKRVIDSFDISDSIKNNMWLAVAYIYVSSNEKRQKPCQFKQLMYKDIVRHGNNISDKLLGELLQKLKDEKIITVNESYSTDLHFAKHYAVSLSYKEYLLDLFHAEQIIELKMAKKCFEAWQLLYKEDIFNILNDDKKEEVEQDFFKEEKENAYEEYEKSCIGYHQNETQQQKLIKERMLNNINFDKKVIGNHINNSSNMYDELNKLISFVKNTKNKTFTTKHGRLYLNGYTNGSKDFRDTFRYGEEQLIELKDIKSCFVLNTVLLSKDVISEKQYKELFELVTNKDIYLDVAYYIYGDKVNKDEKRYRAQSKQYVIHWYFMNNRGKKCIGWSKELTMVKRYLKQRFPEYYQFLINYNQIDDNGKKKSCLSIDCQWLENKLVVNTLFKKFKEYNIVTLHDSLWISEDQYSEQLKKEVDQQWKKILEKYLRKSLKIFKKNYK